MANNNAENNHQPENNHFECPARQYTFYFEGGIASYIRHLNHTKVPKQIIPFYIQKDFEKINVEIALQYTDDFQETVFAFANNILNLEGGTHLLGFRAALTRVLNNFSRKEGYLKEKEENLTGEDVREGLTAVISVKVPEPQFEGQTKAKLGNPEVRTAVETVFSDAFTAFLEEHPQDSRAILEKCVLSSQARQAARTARETILRRTALEGMTLPGKLADCSIRDPRFCELYIVEGDSAGGSSKQARNREFQAILPLRGKILNVERARLDKLLANNELRSLIIALGTNIGDQFDITKLRYHRIIIMSDADVDGAHIRTLLLTFFYRHTPAIITNGHLFIAQPPLYRIQRQKEIKYFYNDAELAQFQKNLANQKPATEESKLNIQRYKGLGEMNPEQLWDTTMDPATRLLKQVTIEDAAKTDESFDILMGSEVEPRKHFIQTHAKAVKNLDI